MTEAEKHSARLEAAEKGLPDPYPTQKKNRTGLWIGLGLLVFAGMCNLMPEPTEAELAARAAESARADSIEAVRADSVEAARVAEVKRYWRLSDEEYAAWGDPPKRIAQNPPRTLRNYLDAVKKADEPIEFDQCGETLRGDDGYVIDCSFSAVNGFGARMREQGRFTFRRGVVVNAEI